jgi:dedicator of cytokinesis protein 3
MPWQPLPRIVFAIATHPFEPSSPADLPLELGDELYIIEQGGKDGSWYRGYLVAPPSLLAGLTCVKGQTLEARVFSGIFPKSCVEVREVLGETSLGGLYEGEEEDEDGWQTDERNATSGTNGVLNEHRTPDAGQGKGPINGTKSGALRPKGSIRKKRHSLTDGPLSRSLSRKRSINREKRLARTRSNRSHRSQRSTLPVSPATNAPRDPSAPKPPAPVPMMKIGDETPTSAQEPLVDEIGSCLKEWHSSTLHELLLARQYPLLDEMFNLVQQLDFSRRQLLHNVLTRHELNLLRESAIWNLVKGNKMLSREVIVRDPAERGRILTGDDSAVEITNLQSIMSLLNAPPVHHVEGVTLHHLFLDIRSFMGVSTEATTVSFYLCCKTPGAAPEPVSETFVVELTPKGSPADPAQIGKMKTLFTDLGSTDLGEGGAAETQLFLVAKIQTTQVSASGGSSASPPTNGTLASGRSPPGIAPSGTVKGGRRSLMWGQKSAAGSRWNQTHQSSRSLSASSSGKQTPNADPPSTAVSEVDANGAATPQTSPQPSQLLVKRNVGVGVLHVGEFLRQEDETEQTLQIWSPIASSAGAGPGAEAQESSEDWDHLIAELVQSPTGRFEKSSRAGRLHLFIKAFNSPDAETLIKKTPTLLHQITKTNKIGFSGAPTKPRSDIYLTIKNAFLPRNALLSHPRTGGMPLSHSANISTVQVTMEIRKSSGEKLRECIFPSSNGNGLTTWKSAVVERGEAWNETLKLVVPAEEVPACHVFLSVGDVVGRPLATSWMPLWEQQAFVRDGNHSLLLYRHDDTTSRPRMTAGTGGGYLSLPWNSGGKDGNWKDEALTGPVATIQLKSYLCSTKFSQEKTLLGLIKWREQPAGELVDLLKHVIFVPEIEVVKLLREVFDALFGILVDHGGNDEYEDLVFNALITVLCIVYDRRFNLGPSVDRYTEQRFNYPFATPCLIRSFTRLLSNPTDPASSRKLRATFKVGSHMLKFIINAREQQKAKEAGIGITSTQSTFTRDLQGIFKSLEMLMKNPAPILVGTQTLAVQHFHTMLPGLSGLLTAEEILHIAIDFMDSCAGVKGKLILYKLILIINFSRLKIFSNPESRQALTANTVRWLAPHWGKTTDVTAQWRDQVRLCCSVLSVQVNELGEFASEYIPKIIDSYHAIKSTGRGAKEAISLLFPKTYPFPTKAIEGHPIFDEALIELSAILAAVSNLPTGIHLDFQEAELSEFLTNALQVHLSILGCEAFPKDWLSVHIYQHKSTMKTLEYLAGILIDSFLPHPDEAEDFNTDLWLTFFTTLLKLVGSDALALETFPEQKRRAVWKIAGDVREQGADLLRRSWEAIGWETSSEDRRRYGLEKMGGYQVQYVPSLVPPIVGLCLSVHEGLRSVAVEVLQTMIVSEWTLSQDLSVVQAEMIDCLDKLFKSNHLTESILQKMFISELTALFEPLAHLPDDPLYLAVKDLIATTDEFLDLLVAVHSTDITSEASHILHTLRLMEFLRDMQKEDIFIRYVHQLNRVQVESRNSAEAGLALQLHAELYEWDPTKQVPALEDPALPEQSAFERKERLYFEMIQHYEDGKAWSNALAAYKELADQYENNIFDFAKLSRAQRAMAAIYDNIVKGDHVTPRYFRVVYSGMGFPLSLRDKQFIFQGSPSEKLSAFTDRMQQQHPSAQIVSAGDIDDVEGQFLQISSVSPHRDAMHAVNRRSKIPNPIREYLLMGWPNVFSVTTRRQVSSLDVKDQWVEKTLYTTAETFPTILRRSEITSTKQIRLSPVQSAMERTFRKTQELTALEKKITDGTETNTALLVDSLNNSVNPSVVGSIALYRTLLPVKEDDARDEPGEEPELDPIETALKTALLDHATVVKRCLDPTQSIWADPQLRPRQEDLSQSESTINYGSQRLTLTSPCRV